MRVRTREPLHRPFTGGVRHKASVSRPLALTTVKVVSSAIGALGLGTIAIGALAVGAVAIGRLGIGRARIRRLEIDELIVRKIRVLEDPESTPTTRA